MPLGRPPGPSGRPILGVLPEYRRAPAEYLLSLARQYGDIVFFRVGPRRMYLLNRPDYIQDVLVTSHANFMKGPILQRAKSLLGEGLLTSEGNLHLRQRRLAQPAFHRPRLMAYASTMVSCADTASERWKAGETRDIAAEMMRLTLAIVGLTLFSRDVEAEASDIGEALTNVLGLFSAMLLPFSSLLQRLPLQKFRRARRAQIFLDQTIYKMIQERRDAPEDKGDLLSMLLLAEDDQGTGRMTDKQVRDEALTLFIAGHETTAAALTWTWFLLANNPAIDEKMRAEIQEIIGSRSPTYDDLPNLRYTEMVFAESMRLYPPAWAVGRMARRDHRVYNYLIPKGSVVLVSPYVMHRNPRYYPDPEKFDPERFNETSRQERPKFAYFPFGGGSRVCIGERFAWMEGVLVLATIAQRWKFTLAPNQTVEPEPMITLRTRNGVRMIVHPAR